MGSHRLYVDRLGPLADGVAMSKRGKVYLDRVAPGDEVEASILEDRNGVLRGTVTQILKASPVRNSPPCPHYDVCGNCSLQHVRADFYRAWKEEKVRDALKKFEITPTQWLPSIFLQGHYRRRVTFSLIKIKGKVLLGYYQRRSQKITEIQQCEVIDPEILHLREFLKAILSPFLQENLPIDIFIQKIGNDLDLVISGVTSLSPAIINELSQLDRVKRISLKSSKGIQVLSKNKILSKKFGNLSVTLPPNCFLQPTEEGEKALVSSILKALPNGKLFADLFCGVGTFTGPLLQKGEVHGYEDNPHAVQSLSLAGKSQPLKVLRRDLFLRPLKKEELNRYDAIVFDPPRAGCAEQSKAIARSRCPLVIGVSCNPATFARDAYYLEQGGYRLKSVQLVDQFMWSHHVELVGVFSKKLPS